MEVRLSAWIEHVYGVSVAIPMFVLMHSLQARELRKRPDDHIGPSRAWANVTEHQLIFNLVRGPRAAGAACQRPGSLPLWCLRGASHVMPES